MRNYRCRGLKETRVHGWNNVFTIGEKYEEAEGPVPSNGNILYLKGNLENGYQTDRYVDADQFEEVLEAEQKYGRVSKKEILWGFGWALLAIIVGTAFFALAVHALLQSV